MVQNNFNEKLTNMQAQQLHNCIQSSERTEQTNIRVKESRRHSKSQQLTKIQHSTSEKLSTIKVKNIVNIQHKYSTSNINQLGTEFDMVFARWWKTGSN